MIGQVVRVVRDTRNLNRTPHKSMRKNKPRTYKVCWISRNGQDIELNLLNKYGKNTGWYYIVKAGDIVPDGVFDKELEDYL